MSGTELSAAEKAEARRLKILAKKNARMKYAAGDRTQLPSVAPAEPVETTPKPASEEVESAPSRANAATSTPPVDGIVPNVPNGILSRAGSSSRQTTNLPRTWALPAASQRLRMISMVLFAVGLVLAVKLDIVEGWTISAPQMFASVELCLYSPLFVQAISGWLMRGNRGNRASLGIGIRVLDFLLNTSKFVSAMRGMFREFALFMVTFLCAWYWLAKL